MKINRHNYEEYFILYLDNELSAEDRQMVESFVILHPDLKDELELLQQTQFSPDQHIVFESKEDLLFGQPVGIRESNYDEWLVQYIDNELSNEQRAMVEKFVATNTDAQKDLPIYQQTKLQPEIITFLDKSSLYRREEKTRRIIGWQIAAAAVLLLMATAGIVIFNRPAAPEEISIAAGSNEDIKPVQPNNTVVPNTSEVKDNNNLAAVDKLPIKKEKVEPVIAQQKKDEVAPVKNDRIEEARVRNEPRQELIAYTPNNNLPVREIANTPELRTTTSNDPTKASQQISNNPTVTGEALASYNNGTPEADDAIIYASENGGRKNKLRGFFRKVTRNFEKRTNIEATDEDERLLIAGLAIKLK